MRIELPGLVDLQVNGFGGIDFNAPDLRPEQALAALERIEATGVTRCLPTLITSSIEAFARNARLLAGLNSPTVAGIHMEGPYLSSEDGPRGAHPREHAVAADIDDFRRRHDAAGGRIVLVTLAPEVPGALTLIEHLVATDVVVAIGHTAASPEQIRDAVSAGARLSTHLGNGCAQMLPRHPNILWEQLANDRLVASLIVDGHHLPAATVKSMVRAKGRSGSILVTDAISAAAAPPGRYTIGTVWCERDRDGRVSLPGTPYLAGSAVTMPDAIGNTARYCGLPLDQVVPMASTIPASLIGLTTRGSLHAEWDAEACELRILEVRTA
jgi:N-acetylglucosamine-6-phosphate deacetylase